MPSVLLNRLKRITVDAKNDHNFYVREGAGLVVESFNDADRTVRMRVIREGWSDNNVYYSQTSLTEIKKFLDTTAKKVYADHNEAGLSEGRRLSEWVGDVVATEISGKELYAVVYIHESGPYAWLYERMRKSPVNFGPSIMGLAQVKEGEAEGRKGKIVQKVTYIRSFDIVTDPAAGGQVMRESYVWSNSEPLLNLSEASQAFSTYLQKLKDRAAESEVRQQFWNLTCAFNSLAEDLIFAGHDFEDIAVQVRKDEFGILITDAVTEFLKLPFKEPKAESSGSTSGEITGKATEGNRTKAKEKVMKTLAELKNEYGELCIILAKEAVEAYKQSIDSEATVKENERLVKENAELAESVKTLTEESAKRKSDLDAATAKLAEESAKAQKALCQSIIAEEIKKSGLDEKAVTEVFKGILGAVAFTDDASYRKAVAALCEDRKGVVNTPIKKVTNAGFPVKEGTDTKGDDEFPVTEKAFVEAVENR